MTTIGRVGSSSTTKNQNGDRKKERAGLEEATREQQQGIEREKERERVRGRKIGCSYVTSRSHPACRALINPRGVLTKKLSYPRRWLPPPRFLNPISRRINLITAGHVCRESDVKLCQLVAFAIARNTDRDETLLSESFWVRTL